MCFNATFYNIFSYILKTSFSGGGSRSTRREPPTMGKQLVNFTTCGCESSALFFVIYKARLLCNSYTCQLYIFFVLGQKLKCRELLSENIPLKKHLTNPAVLLIHLSEYSWRGYIKTATILITNLKIIYQNSDIKLNWFWQVKGDMIEKLSKIFRHNIKIVKYHHNNLSNLWRTKFNQLLTCRILLY